MLTSNQMNHSNIIFTNNAVAQDIGKVYLQDGLPVFHVFCPFPTSLPSVLSPHLSPLSCFPLGHHDLLNGVPIKVIAPIVCAVTAVIIVFCVIVSIGFLLKYRINKQRRNRENNLDNSQHHDLNETLLLVRIHIHVYIYNSWSIIDNRIESEIRRMETILRINDVGQEYPTVIFSFYNNYIYNR